MSQTQYKVYEKNRLTDDINLVNVFSVRQYAETWMEDMMNIWEEERSYKIVEKEK